MSKEKKGPEPPEGDEGESFEIPYSGEVTIPLAENPEEPPAAPPGKQIHRRRPLPPVADRAEPEECEPD